MTRTAPPASCSRLADGILVINLDHRPERLERFGEMARGTTMLQGWERIVAVNGVDIPGYGKPPWFRHGKRDKCWAGRAGCALSHRKAIEYAKDKGWGSVLILEDDIQIGGSFEADAVNFLKTESQSPGGWDVCYLGLSKQVGPGRKLHDLDENRAVYEIFGCLGAFAYLLKRDCYDWILERLPREETIWTWMSRHRAIDRWYARNLSRRFTIHAVSPNLIGHYSSFSDIGQRAGAHLAIHESEGMAPDRPRSTGAPAFHILSWMLRIGFSFARAASGVRGTMKRIRGF